MHQNSSSEQQNKKKLILAHVSTQANSNLDFHIALFHVLILFSEERQEQIDNCWQVHGFAFQKGGTIMFSLCLWPHCVLLAGLFLCFDKRFHVGADTSIF